MKIVIIDAQGGGIGRALIEGIRKEDSQLSLIAVGTNALATSAMLKAGASAGATGENAVRVCCRDADIIAGPIGIVFADAMLGEITPMIAQSIGSSSAEKVLVPVTRCHTHVAGLQEQPLMQFVVDAVQIILHLAHKGGKDC